MYHVTFLLDLNVEVAEKIFSNLQLGARVYMKLIVELDTSSESKFLKYIVP
jgi:hypothetical protein